MSGQKKIILEVEFLSDVDLKIFREKLKNSNNVGKIFVHPENENFVGWDVLIRTGGAFERAREEFMAGGDKSRAEGFSSYSIPIRGNGFGPYGGSDV